MGPKGRSFVPETRRSSVAEARVNVHTRFNCVRGCFWFAVWTRSRQEKVAASMLEAIGIRHFLPLKTEVHRWSDRDQAVTIPLFRGYLFVQLDPTKDSRLRVLNIPGVAGLVGNQNGPLPIPDKEIDGIRTVLAEKVTYSPYPFFTLGERVRVRHGALAGVEGRLVRSNTDAKLVLSVEMIQQSIAVNVRASDVEGIDPSPTPEKVSSAPTLSVA